MARPLRILLAGGWYHVVSRGNRREALFLDDTDRRRFLGLVAELPDRFKLEVHAFVLMENHYHLLVRTPEPNLSDAIRWLNVSFSSRFNWAHRQVGHVFQGRFKAQIIETEKGVVEVARYVHLNPVRVGELGLSKTDQRRAKQADIADPGADLISRRLQTLHEFRWSSWRVYSGVEPNPSWLDTSVLSRGAGGRNLPERRAAFRAYTEAPVREGYLECPWDRLVGGLVLGEVEFAQQLLKQGRTDPAEQTEVRRIERTRRTHWSEVRSATERLRGRRWSEMAETYGEWGRDAALYVATRYGGLRLAEIVGELPGLSYQAAAQGIRRFRKAAETDADRASFVAALRKQLSTI